MFGLAQVFGLPQEAADRECRHGREAEQEPACLGCVTGPSCQLLSGGGCGERGGPQHLAAGCHSHDEHQAPAGLSMAVRKPSQVARWWSSLVAG
jgi:hypothetical protein